MLTSTVATLTRGEAWRLDDVSEPYEAGWALEAQLFARGLDSGDQRGKAHVQVSPDGIRWCDEGSTLDLLPGDALSFIRLREFGHFVRLRVDLPEGIERTFLVTIALKG
ncbi:hypothetical protein [Devosia sp. 2618]|uniref:hypothetical protein n=1 Tax=Devosia sp. 2618 TaxID=3156454 RepID=UPI003393A400